MSDTLSRVGIVNDAFAKIGVSRIDDWGEDNEQGRYAEQRFQKVFDALIEAHPWNFAKCRTTLAASLEAPSFGYAYQFELPGGGDIVPRCLRVLEEYEGNEYIIEGRNLLSDSQTIQIIYLGQITEANITKLTPLFVEALSDRLAADAAYWLLGDMNKEQLMLQRFAASMRAAMYSDATQGTPKSRPLGSWIEARRRGSSSTAILTEG